MKQPVQHEAGGPGPVRDAVSKTEMRETEEDNRGWPPPYTHRHTFKGTHISTHRGAHTHIYTQRNTQAHMQRRAHIYTTHTYTNRHIYTDKGMQTRMHTCRYTYSYSTYTYNHSTPIHTGRHIISL